MIKVGIVGSTGYGGQELVRLLLGHNEVEIVWLSSQSYLGQQYNDIYQSFFKIIDTECVGDNLLELADEVDVIFFATPQGVCFNSITEELLTKVKVIDLSADYRIKDVNVYETWYNVKHNSAQFIEEAVYGLCELYRDDIKNARLIANPGCYPTCTTLAIRPLLKAGLIDPSTLIIDAKSGTSGAGRGANVANLYCEVNESIKAYGVSSHRHTPEIEQELSFACNQNVMINFTPHLIPINRGILITAYASLKNGVTTQQVEDAYKCYDNEQFVRVLPNGRAPEVRSVKVSNYVDISFKIDPRTNRIIMMGAMDNLVKGAAGQAIQNMNIMFGIEETKGLLQAPAIL